MNSFMEEFSSSSSPTEAKRASMSQSSSPNPPSSNGNGNGNAGTNNPARASTLSSSSLNQFYPEASTSSHSSLPQTQPQPQQAQSRPSMSVSITSTDSLANGGGGQRRHSYLGAGSGGQAMSPDVMDRDKGQGGRGEGGEKEAVPVAFDEAVLRALCDLDCALPLITERIKQSISSCKAVATFLRSRADLEDKYARGMLELVRITGEGYGRGGCKAGTFVDAYHASLRLHDTLASSRLRFSQRLIEMSDELMVLAREGERLRKVHKENGGRLERVMLESEMGMEKAKARFDQTAEELERILITKEGESPRNIDGMRSLPSSSPSGLSSSSSSAPGGGKRGLGKAMQKGGMLFKGKGPAQMQRQEDEVRGRMSIASDVFRKAVGECQSSRQEYYGMQLPKILRQLKECADELDLGTQYHLARYAFLYEATILADGAAVAPMGPEDGPGLKTIVESIDNRGDFKSFMQNYAVARGSRSIRRDYTPSIPSQYQADTSTLSNTSSNPPHPQHNGINNSGGDDSSSLGGPVYPIQSSSRTFGVPLDQQIVGEEVPKIVEKCIQAVEMFGMDSQGIYRISGVSSKVQSLKAALDADVDSVDLLEEGERDINAVASLLKLWLRELPEPLLATQSAEGEDLYGSFMRAAELDNPRLRHIRTHEAINNLPDSNYACIKRIGDHLYKVQQLEGKNSMNISNLSIVFGPTLLGSGGNSLDDMSSQCKVVETILERYREIFVEEEEQPPM